MGAVAFVIRFTPPSPIANLSVGDRTATLSGYLLTYRPTDQRTWYGVVWYGWGGRGGGEGIHSLRTGTGTGTGTAMGINSS